MEWKISVEKRREDRRRKNRGDEGVDWARRGRERRRGSSSSEREREREQRRREEEPKDGPAKEVAQDPSETGETGKARFPGEETCVQKAAATGGSEREGKGRRAASSRPGKSQPGRPITAARCSQKRGELQVNNNDTKQKEIPKRLKK